MRTVNTLADQTHKRVALIVWFVAISNRFQVYTLKMLCEQQENFFGN